MYMISGDSNYAGQNVNLGGVTIMFVDYGIIVMGVFISSLIRFFRNVPDKFLVICWIIINIFSTVNTQLFWFSLLLVLTTSIYTKNIIWKQEK